MSRDTRQDLFFQQKFSNMLKWVDRVQQRYAVPEGYCGALEELKHDTKAQKELATNRAAHCIIASKMPEVIKTLQNFYNISDAEREHEAEKIVQQLETIRDRFNEVIENIKANKNELPDDLKTIGAYATIFFGDFIH